MSFPALTIGSEFTVTITESLFVQPFASVPVTIYVFVLKGENVVLFITLLFQVYVLPPYPFNFSALFKQIAVSLPAFILGSGLTVMVKFCTGPSHVTPAFVK